MKRVSDQGIGRAIRTADICSQDRPGMNTDPVVQGCI